MSTSNIDSITHCFTISLNQLQGQGEVPILALPKIVKIARLASGIHVEAGARPHPCMSPPRHDLPDTKRGDWAEHGESRPAQEKSESAALCVVDLQLRIEERNWQRLKST